MEQKLSYRERKRAEEKLFTQKQVDDKLKDAQHKLDVQYSVLKEVYTKYETLKKEHELLKRKALPV